MSFFVYLPIKYSLFLKKCFKNIDNDLIFHKKRQSEVLQVEIIFALASTSTTGPLTVRIV